MVVKMRSKLSELKPEKAKNGNIPEKLDEKTSRSAYETMRNTDRPNNFEHNGNVYTKRPSTEIFFSEMSDAKLLTPSMSSKLKNIFLKEELTHFSSFENLTESNLALIDGISEKSARVLVKHRRVIAAEGSAFKTFKQQMGQAKSYMHLKTNVLELNFKLFDGFGLGFRSGTLIEFYGAPQMGKTQWMYDLAFRCMLPKEKGGWNRSVLYFDTEGAFSVVRLLKAGTYWGLDEHTFNEKFFCVSPHLLKTGTDLLGYMEQIEKVIIEKDVGLIVIDSLIQPFRTEFSKVTGEGLSFMVSRQSLLGKTLARLKSLAHSFNLMVCYTNHVIANIGNSIGPTKVPVGGDTVGHASDLRFYLSKTSPKQGYEMRKMILKDCGWLPSFDVEFVLTSYGIMSHEDASKAKAHMTKQENAKKRNVDNIEVNHLGDIISKSEYLNMLEVNHT